MTILEHIKSLDGKDIAKLATGLGLLISAAVGSGVLIGGDEPAICLDSPFSMRLSCGGGTNDFERLILTEDVALGKAEKGRRFLQLRQVRSSFDIAPVGVIVAQDFRKAKKAPSLLDSLSAVSSAEAAYEAFTWRGHENDSRFKESRTKTGEIERTYSDGCVLAYQLDSTGKSIPATFRWVRKTH